jgi:D-alanyl-lipoteichoic acid acyltransferase DltB (MBOAT superfamily)
MVTLKEGNKKKYFFYAGCALNILVLGYYKYFTTIYDGITHLFAGGNYDTLHDILIPIGLSFYTFQLIAYWIDSYNENIEPEKDLIAFGVYIFYFPKMVSGPIELSQNFLPQVHHQRVPDVDLIIDGLRQFLWGFFKKSVVSMHVLTFYNLLFQKGLAPSSLDVILGSMLYIVYVYTDFSGYSDMACGISKTFGIRLTNNFANPFFATNISDFWKRWHISLTNWILTYVFTPLSFIFRKSGKAGIVISIMISFLLVGIWHGLTLNFIVFGLMNGLFFIPMVLKGGSIQGEQNIGGVKGWARVSGTFLLVSLTSLLTREIPINESFQQIFSILTSKSFKPNLEVFHGLTYLLYWGLIVLCFVVEYSHKNKEHGLSIAHYSARYRWSAYTILLLLIFFFGSYNSKNFVYVQF